MKNFNTSIYLGRFDLLISSKADSTQLVIRLYTQAGSDKSDPLANIL